MIILYGDTRTPQKYPQCFSLLNKHTTIWQVPQNPPSGKYLSFMSNSTSHPYEHETVFKMRSS